jgi:hypothetical protein
MWDDCDYVGLPDNDTDVESSACATLSHALISSVVANDDGNLEWIECEEFCQDQIFQLYALPPSK